MKVRLSKDQKLQIANSEDLYTVMRAILMRENKLERTREHLWAVSLATNGFILNIELVALGSLNKVIITPGDVFSFVMQKRAAAFVLVHNHPSGTLKPSDADLDLTDKMQQLGKFHNLPLRDHLIITEDGYYSMADQGDMARLMIHTKYPIHLIEKIDELEEAKKKTAQAKAAEIAKAMKLYGMSVKEISVLTGLSEDEVEKLK